MDAFFVSVEIRDNPSLANFPVAVGGRSTDRGVLSTCNYIARQYGLHSAMPTSTAIKKCPELLLVPSRMQVYKDVSAQIREIFSRYTHLIEPLSLDEAYLDVTGSNLFQGSATLIAQDIRQTIESELQLTASAGIAPIKFLAKIASDLNKPNGQFVITPNKVHHFIAKLPLDKISGVGKVTYDKLKKLNLRYGQDIQLVDYKMLVDQFGKFGHVLYQRCQGIDERKVETARLRKSVGVERTFNKNTDDISLLHDILIKKLIPELKRRSQYYLDNGQINKLGVKIKFSDFQQTTKEFTHSSFDASIFLQLLDEVIKRGNGKKVRLLGVHIGLSDKNNNAQQFEFSW